MPTRMTSKLLPLVFRIMVLGGLFSAPPLYGINLPFVEDFEGGLGDWTVSGTGTTRTELTSEFGPRSGSRHVLLSSTTNQSEARNELTVVADLAGE